MKFIDILYKEIEFSGNDLRLFQTREMQRLRKVSVNTMPTWTVPMGNCCTRFEHSVGVWHLAKLLGQKPAFREISKNLELAALAHDLGAPPFSHGSERMMKKVLGRGHEEMISEILYNSEFGTEAVKQGGDLDRISDLIQGKLKPFGDLINNTIDLDNLDNTLRFNLAIGLEHQITYSPEKLALNFDLRDGELVLLSGEGLKEWEDSRAIAYPYIYDASIETLIHRLIDLVYEAGEISAPFFKLDDFTAWNYLKNSSDRAVKKVVERMERWDFYPLIYKADIPEVSAEAEKKLSDPEVRNILSNKIIKEFKVLPQNIAIGIFKNKGFKKIHIPIINGGSQTNHEPNQKQFWIIRVFLHKLEFEKKEKIRSFINEEFSLDKSCGLDKPEPKTIWY